MFAPVYLQALYAPADELDWTGQQREIRNEPLGPVAELAQIVVAMGSCRLGTLPGRSKTRQSNIGSMQNQ